MAKTNESVGIVPEQVELGKLGSRIVLVGLVVGVLGLLATALLGYASEDGGKRVLYSYLVSYAFFLSLMLGALFFVILQHVVRAGWSVAVRRIAEIFSANAVLMAVLALPLVLFAGRIFPWTDPEVVEADPLLQGKTPYLNMTFFVIRCVVYFVVWFALSRYFLRGSLAQDRTGDWSITTRLERRGAPAIFLFALSLTFFSFDFLMSLDPVWFSTIFGVYYFAGSTVGYFALASITAAFLQRSGRLGNLLTAEHYQDLGKLTFAFVVFWAYIAFSQYMLIWYANLPEETGWLIRRQSNGWEWVGLVLLFGHFLVPFLFLMSRHVKRFMPGLVAGCLWVLAMHWVDIYWLVMPELSPDSVPLHLLDLTSLVGIGGLFVAATAYRMRRHPLVPVKDPRLGESLVFENA